MIFITMKDNSKRKYKLQAIKEQVQSDEKVRPKLKINHISTFLFAAAKKY